MVINLFLVTNFRPSWSLSLPLQLRLRYLLIVRQQFHLALVSKINLVQVLVVTEPEALGARVQVDCRLLAEHFVARL